MGKQEIDFALGFLLEHPEAAVKVLEQGNLAAVAEFVDIVPENYVAPVLRKMLPEYAARLCSTLAPAKTSALMEALDINAVTGILRLCTPPSRTAILAELPAKKRRSAELLLEYSPRMVGAWMTPHCLTLPESATAGDAGRYLKQDAGTGNGGEFLYIVNREGELLGRCPLVAILKSGKGMPLTSLMDSQCPTLPAPMLLEQALEHKAWQDTDTLPVLSRQQRFLGVLRHSALRRGVQRMQAGQAATPRGNDPVSSILEVYGQSLLALFNTVSEAVDNDK